MTSDQSRRDFIVAGSALAGLALLPGAVHAATAPARTWPGYAGAIVIDSCGSPGGNSNDPPGSPISAAELEAVHATGLTAINFTVGSVGRYAHDYEETIRTIAWCDREIAA